MDDVPTIEGHIFDVDELKGTDIKINPDYYIHQAMLKAQTALAQDNIQEGFLKFRMLIEHIEVLCKASGMLKESYLEDIKEFKTSEDFTSADPDIREIRLANKKIEFIMSMVFKNKTLTSPLKI